MPTLTKHRGSNPAISYSDLSDGTEGKQLTRLSAVGLVVVGIGVLLLGLAWPRLFPVNSYWSDSQAKEYTAAAIALKVAADSDARRLNQPDPPELVAAKARWAKVESDITLARAKRTWSPILVLALGGVLTGAGVAVWLKAQAPEGRWSK